MKNLKNYSKNRLMVLWTLLPFAKTKDKHNHLDNYSKPEISNQFKLYANYPNPFSTITIIYFALMHYSRVQIHIYNAAGKKILTVIDENMQAGIQRVPLYKVMNDITLTAGNYQCRLVVTNSNGTFKQSHTLTVL